MANIVIGFSGKFSGGGTPTTLTTEPSTLVSGKTYQIANAAKRVLDPATAIVIYQNDGTTLIAASNILNVNAMNGEVTFISSFTPTGGAPKFSGKYIPRAALARVKSGEGNPKRGVQDVTQTNQGGYDQFVPTTMSIAGNFVIYDYLGDQALDVVLSGLTPYLLEIDPDGTAACVIRAWVLLTKSTGAIAPKAANEAATDYVLYDQSPIATALSGFTVNAAMVVGST